MDDPAPLYLGVDGGGSACRARLVDAGGRILGTGAAGAANIRLGLANSWAAILDAADQALTQAGLDRAALAAISAGLGLAGIARPADIERLRAAGPRFARLAIESDAHAACLGAFAGGDGAILIIGTGSRGYAQLDNACHSVGGWGFEVSDQGSGADIGRAAIRAALLAHDRLGPATGFTDAVLARLGGDPPAALAWVETARPRDYAEFAPETLRYAGLGDPVAAALIESAAADLGRLIRRLQALGAARICLLGGLAASVEPWLPPWARAVLAAPRGDAIDGAILMARLGGAGP